MTTLEIITLAAKIQIGTRVQAGKSILRVVTINKHGFECINEYAESKGYTTGNAIIPFEYLLNPHYNKNYKIID